MKSAVVLICLFVTSVIFSQERQKILPKEIQIKTALLPAPEEVRGQTTVYGYNETGDMVLLQEGTNNLVCLADNPNEKGIQVSCYNVKLEPFMKRGRELKAEGMGVQEIRAKRKQEVDAGTLLMPDAPSMVYVLSGSEEDYNPETGDLEDAFLRYVIYTPFATTESTGLPDKPHAPGMPWLMDPGTHRAHIMITPAKNERPKL